jgi:NADP-dependent 3-hydroxy acid dehydrogenase YdfG
MFLGRTATPMQADLHEQQETSYHPEALIQPEDVALTLLSMLMLPHTSEVTDIHIRPMRKSPT